MPRLPSFQLAQLLFAGALVGAGAHAAELGDARVNSYLGQSLSADIELTSLHDVAGQVQVRVASVDVYRGAGLEMPAVLSSVSLNVVRRDGKQFVHITSTRPIEADHLHLYLELADGGQRGVRLATLWFAPDPAPPRMFAAPVPAQPVVQAIAPARKPHVPARTLPLRPVRPLPELVRAAPIESTPLPLVAAKTEPQANAEAKPAPAAARPEPKELKPAATTTQLAKPVPPVAAARAGAKPAPAAARPEPKESNSASPIVTTPKTAPAKPEPAKPAAAAKASDAPKPPPLVLSTAKAKQPPPTALALPKPAPSCPKEPSQAEGACSGLDSKNAELRAELVKLEARVKTLQDEAQARAKAAALAAAAPKLAEATKTPAPPAPKPVEALKPPAPLAPKPASAPMPPAPPAPKPAEAPKSAPTTSEKSSRDESAKNPHPGEKFSQAIAEPAVFKPIKLKAVLPVSPPPPQPEPEHAGMPWGWIAGAGAGVFALIGGLQLWRHRRGQAKVHKVHAPLPDHDDEQVEPTLG